MESSLKKLRRNNVLLKILAVFLWITIIGMLIISCSYFSAGLFNFKIALTCGIACIVIMPIFVRFILLQISQNNSIIKSQVSMEEFIKNNNQENILINNINVQKSKKTHPKEMSSITNLIINKNKGNPSQSSQNIAQI